MAKKNASFFCICELFRLKTHAGEGLWTFRRSESSAPKNPAQENVEPVVCPLHNWGLRTYPSIETNNEDPTPYVYIPSPRLLYRGSTPEDVIIHHYERLSLRGFVLTLKCSKFQLPKTRCQQRFFSSCLPSALPLPFGSLRRGAKLSGAVATPFFRLQI